MRAVTQDWHEISNTGNEAPTPQVSTQTNHPTRWVLIRRMTIWVQAWVVCEATYSMGQCCHGIVERNVERKSYFWVECGTLNKQREYSSISAPKANCEIYGCWFFLIVNPQFICWGSRCTFLPPFTLTFAAAHSGGCSPLRINLTLNVLVINWQWQVKECEKVIVRACK